MNFVDWHIGDWIKQTRALTKVERAVYELLVLSYYVQEGPFPDDVDELYRAAEARTGEERKATDYVVRKFFLHTPGTGYSHADCDRLIHAYHEKIPAAEKKKAADRERQERARERRANLFAQLRALGITAPWDATTRDLEAALHRAREGGVSGEKSAAVTPPVTRPVTPPVTRDNTATSTHSPLPSSQRDTSSSSAGATADVTGARALSDSAREAADAMKGAGLTHVDAGDPMLLQLLREGMTQPELRSAAQAAVRQKKGFAWALARAKGRREDAVAAGALPPAPEPASSAPAGRDPALVKIDQDSKRAARPPREVRELAARLKAAP